MNLKHLILIIGFSIISACASNEATMDANENTADMAKAESTAAMEEVKAEESTMKEEATTAVAEAEEEIETTATETKAATSDSRNLVATCNNGNQVRTITVVYDNQDTDTVCEVTYEKSIGVQTLWSANNDKNYCMEQATAFVAKQEGWGWTCSNLE